MKNSLFTLVGKLLKKNNISFDKEELIFQIQSHPSYPSLHAITGVLDHFNIENVAADVPTNSETLNQLPNCFLAQISLDNGEDLTIVEKNEKNGNLELFFSDGKKEIINTDDFLKKFTGIIVAVDKNENTQHESGTNSITVNKILLGLIGLISIAYLINIDNSLYKLSFFLLSLVGIVISVSIIRQEQGYKTIIGDAFCSGETEKKDCNAVLTSKGAEIFKKYKLSDLSILYFSILSLICFVSYPNIELVKVMSLLSLPITFYSIYYQYAVVKKWCLLCLSIVGVLWIQAALAAYVLPKNLNLNVQSILTVTLIISSVYLIWNYIKPQLSDLKELKEEKIESTKFKRNYNLFNGLLTKSPTIDTKIINAKEIILGNKNAKLEIVVITNPFCGHCKPVHKLVDKILNRYNDQVKIIIRFNVFADDIESDTVKVTTRLLEIYNTNGQLECLEAMNSIYNGKDASAWIKHFGKTNDVNPYLEVLNVEKEWCNNHAINFTPEILVNGKSYPKEYKREDLIFFIEDLEENSIEAVSLDNTINT